MARVGRASFTLLGKAGSGFAQAITTSAELKHDYKGMSDATNEAQIGTYLQDHYAGGIGALELIEHSIKAHAGTPLAAFFAEWHDDIKADCEQLQQTDFERLEKRAIERSGRVEIKRLETARAVIHKA